MSDTTREEFADAAAARVRRRILNADRAEYNDTVTVDGQVITVTTMQDAPSHPSSTHSPPMET